MADRLANLEIDLVDRQGLVHLAPLLHRDESVEGVDAEQHRDHEEKIEGLASSRRPIA